MKLFVFAIGGTGARVLRALTMLLAAGAKTPDNLTVVPILLDMDMQNGDTARTLETINLYRTIRAGAYSGAAATRADFFATPIESLGVQQANGVQEHIGDSFLPQLVEHQGTFEEFMTVSSMDDIDRELLKLLYDNSAKPTSRELKLDLSVGFKGNPNIGSVVFNALEDSVAFKYFTSAFNIDTDRIFVISSIFGGTGSSGFPQLIKLLQESSQKAPIRTAKKGAVTVMPYFSLHENNDSAIDQNRFNSKTKAALSYYQTQLKLDALYYIGDKPGAKPYTNIEGGAKQTNNAHVIELLAAEAVLDFANRKSGELINGQTFYEYGLQRNDHELNFVHFADSTYNNVLLPLLRLAYAAKIYTDFIPANLTEDFAKKTGLNLGPELANNAYFVALRAFLGKSAPEKMQASLRDWLTEMADNDRKLDLFSFGSDFNGFVRAKLIETKSFFGIGGEKGINEDFLLKEANLAEKTLKTTYPQTEPRLMHLLMVLADKCIGKLGQLNRQIV